MKDAATLLALADQRLEAENVGLRIALWNALRASGVTQDRAIQVIREAAKVRAHAAIAGEG